MSHKINEKLGLTPNTRTRAATHGRAIVSAAKCPKCPSRHVVQVEIDGLLRRLCGACGHGWYPTKDELAAEAP